MKIHESFMKYITRLSTVEGINMENSGWLRTGERDSRKDKTVRRRKLLFPRLENSRVRYVFINLEKFFGLQTKRKHKTTSHDVRIEIFVSKFSRPCGSSSRNPRGYINSLLHAILCDSPVSPYAELLTYPINYKCKD